MKQTLKQAKYQHIKKIDKGEHIMLDTITGLYELWHAGKNKSNFGLIYKNTHLEYGRHVDKNFLAANGITP